MGTIVVGAILLVVVCGIIMSMVRSRKQGKSLSCGMKCQGCSGRCDRQADRDLKEQR